MDVKPRMKGKQKQPSGRRRKQCALGSACPYQRQYQHTLEFEHSSDEASVPQGKFKPFQGPSHRLGAAPAVNGTEIRSSVSKQASAELSSLRSYRPALIVIDSNTLTSSPSIATSSQEERRLRVKENPANLLCENKKNTDLHEKISIQNNFIDLT